MHGAVAQLGEHLLCKQGVTGSIPVSSTITPLKGDRQISERVNGGGLGSNELYSSLTSFAFSFFNNLE